MRIDELDEGVMKSLGRALRGWSTGPVDNKPKDVVKRNKSYDDETTAKLHKTAGGPEHSPAGLQKRVLDREMKKRGLNVEEGHYRSHGSPSAYDRDYQSSISGMGRRERDMDDESNLLYIYQSGRVMQKMVSNRVEREARAQGFRDTPEQALKVHGIIKSKFKPGKWVQKHGTQWVEVHPFGKPEGVAESATAGATSAASIGTVDNPSISPGKARGKKSYTGSPSTGSGTKAPPQPKVVQPKNSNGTAKNGLDMKGANLFGGPANESAVIKRR